MAPRIKFAHVVYRTHHLDEMIDWYVHALECRVQHRDDRLAFLTYDDEHHRIALVNLGPPHASEPEPGPSIGRTGVGVHHVAYTWTSLQELMDLYRRLKDSDVLPLRCIRHGPTFSMYYADPDGNALECQIDLLSADDANTFMRGPAFAGNPIGEPFDPEEVIAGLAAGKPVTELVLRSDQKVTA